MYTYSIYLTYMAGIYATNYNFILYEGNEGIGFYTTVDMGVCFRWGEEGRRGRKRAVWCV